MNKIIAIVGMCGSGKSIASDYYESRGYQKVYFGGVTMDKLKEENLEINPENEQMMRERLRNQYGMGAYAFLLLPKISKLLANGNVVLDGLYSWDELKILKSEFPEMIVLAIIVDKKHRYERLSSRTIRPFNEIEANKRDINEIENLAKGGPIAFADYYILNNDNIESYYKDLDKVTKIIEGVE